LTTYSDRIQGALLDARAENRLLRRVIVHYLGQKTPDAARFLARAEYVEALESVANCAYWMLDPDPKETSQSLLCHRFAKGEVQRKPKFHREQLAEALFKVANMEATP